MVVKSDPLSITVFTLMDARRLQLAVLSADKGFKSGQTSGGLFLLSVASMEHIFERSISCAPVSSAGIFSVQKAERQPQNRTV